MTTGRRLALTAVVLFGSVAAATRGVVTAEPPQPGPRARTLYIVTDSVGLGAANAFTTAFPGWQVTLDGDAGEFTETLERKYVASRIAATPGVFGDYAIVAAGYNYPYWDPDRFDRSIDSMIATLTRAGVKHVLWVTLREVKPQFVSPAAWRQIQPYYWYFPRVNEHLRSALDRHPNLSLIDFAAAADLPGLTYDAIHLTSTGAALYTSLARQAIIDATTQVPDLSVTRVAIPDPAGVEAVALNLTTVAPRAAGFLAAYDCDQPQPNISNHNYAHAQVAAHSVIVGVSDSGEVCILARRATNLVVDITGRFSSGVGGSTPARLIDTRAEGGPLPGLLPRAVPEVGAPGTVTALSVTAVDAGQPGWVRAAPCDSTDTTSTVNVTSAAAVPNLTVVGGGSPICVTASSATHVLVDRFVSFDSAAGFDVRTPRRVTDTRLGEGVPLAAGETMMLDAATLGTTATTAGVMLNLTAVGAEHAGFLTAYPCRSGRPATSSVNYAAGDVVANFAVVAPDADGDVCLYSLSSTHIVVDLLGATSLGFTGGAPRRLLDTRVDQLPLAWP